MLMAVMMIRVSEICGTLMRGEEFPKSKILLTTFKSFNPWVVPGILQLRSFEAVPDPNTSTTTGAPAPCRL